MKKLFLFLFFSLFLEAQEFSIHIYKPINSTCPKVWFDDISNKIGKPQIISLLNVKNLKHQIGIPKEIQSCNTSIIDDYIFEGNVPILAIQEFLRVKPQKAIGLSLPAYENEKKIKKVYIIFEDRTYKEFGKYK